MCESLPCPLHGQNCRYCLNSVEGEIPEAGAIAGTNTITAHHAS